MAAIYARWILSGRMTLDDVPALWRGAVAALLSDKDADAP